ncbi:MAG: DUF1109 domain-containing protein [Phenylobacterium sp.]|nr:DUF1109 domain-containing protein [Phenylobacterium sp.]
MTEDLIESLARSTRPVGRGAIPRRLAIAGSGAAIIALIGVLVLLGVRADLPDALATSPFWIKAVYTAGVGAAGIYMALRLSRPGVRLGLAGGIVVLALTALVAALGVIEMAAAAPSRRMDLWLGSSWRTCPFWIVGLSSPLLLAGLWVLRRGAPTSPGLAGAALGLAAGGVAATIYGLHCNENAAAFLATWYVAGILATSGVGALIGRLGLRW